MSFSINTLINPAVRVLMFFSPFSQVLAGTVRLSFCLTLALTFGRSRSRGFILAVAITITRTITITCSLMNSLDLALLGHENISLPAKLVRT
jgi:hypothetical protein